ncbi:MAG: hypothetical protein ACI910_001869 [Oleispira sp.]|jgi:hypothetical protein
MSESSLGFFCVHSIIDFTHTYVLFALRVQNLAEQFVEAGLAWAKKTGFSNRG